MLHVARNVVRNVCKLLHDVTCRNNSANSKNINIKGINILDKYLHRV